MNFPFHLPFRRARVTPPAAALNAGSGRPQQPAPRAASSPPSRRDARHALRLEADSQIDLPGI